VSSIAVVVARHVDHLIELRAQDLPTWLTHLAAPPAGWRLARIEANPTMQPARFAVHGDGDHPNGGWDGFEAVSVFGFIAGGTLLADVVRDNAACTLRDLHGENITTGALATPPAADAAAVRSSGYFNAGSQQVWAQYSTYVTASNAPGTKTAHRARLVHRLRLPTRDERRHRPTQQHGPPCIPLGGPVNGSLPGTRHLIT
jgi:hypothetical protein